MKLYLSSFRLGRAMNRLPGLAGGSKRVAFIPNALDFMEDSAVRDKVIQRGIDDLKGLGLDSKVIDLRKHFNGEGTLRETLSEFRALFVSGGNVFVLRRAMRQSALDSYLQEKVNQSDFLYAGYSAGACVVSPTLKGLDKVDDPQIIPQGYQEDIIWGGLALIDYNLIPHYKSDHPESNAMNKVVEFCIENKILFKSLRDGDVVVHE